MTKFLCFVLIVLNLVTNKGLAETNLSTAGKYVIGTSDAGFFSNFFQVLNHIAWCKKNNKIPVVYWDERSPYYQQNGYHGCHNVWNYYFWPVSKLVYKKTDSIHRDFFAPDGSGVDCRKLNTLAMISSKVWAHPIIKSHIRVRSYIQAKIDDFYKTTMEGKKTIGIHLRGTDKYLEVLPLGVSKIIEEAKKYECDQYLIATDEQSLLDEAIKLLPKPVIYYNSTRSTNGSPIHHAHGSNKARLGEEVLIEAVLLSKCHKFIHTCSNVSIAVHFFNPDLDYVLMQ